MMSPGIGVGNFARKHLACAHMRNIVRNAAMSRRVHTYYTYLSQYSMHTRAESTDLKSNHALVSPPSTRDIIVEALHLEAPHRDDVLIDGIVMIMDRMAWARGTE